MAKTPAWTRGLAEVKGVRMFVWTLLDHTSFERLEIHPQLTAANAAKMSRLTNFIGIAPEATALSDTGLTANVVAQSGVGSIGLGLFINCLYPLANKLASFAKSKNHFLNFTPTGALRTASKNTEQNASVVFLKNRKGITLLLTKVRLSKGLHLPKRLLQEFSIMPLNVSKTLGLILTLGICLKSFTLKAAFAPCQVLR